MAVGANELKKGMYIKLWVPLKLYSNFCAIMVVIILMKLINTNDKCPYSIINFIILMEHENIFPTKTLFFYFLWVNVLCKMAKKDRNVLLTIFSFESILGH